MSSDTKTVFTATKFHIIEHQAPTLRHTVQHPGAVAIIPLLEGGRVCLIRNDRVAINKTLIELPAGTLEPPEQPRRTAERELQEETGFTASTWRELPGFFMSPGILNERMHLFVAEGLTAGPPAREADEAIDNLIVEWDHAVEMALEGQIEDAKSIAGILMWDRLRKLNVSR